MNRLCSLVHFKLQWPNFKMSVCIYYSSLIFIPHFIVSLGILSLSVSSFWFHPWPWSLQSIYRGDNGVGNNDKYGKKKLERRNLQQVRKVNNRSKVFLEVVYSNAICAACEYALRRRGKVVKVLLPPAIGSAALALAIHLYKSRTSLHLFFSMQIPSILSTTWYSGWVFWICGRHGLGQAMICGSGQKKCGQSVWRACCLKMQHFPLMKYVEK